MNEIYKEILINIRYKPKEIVKMVIIKPFQIIINKDKDRKNRGNKDLDFYIERINNFKIVIALGIAIFIYSILAKKEVNIDYIDIIKNILNLSTTIFLAVFGVVFTGFSIFTALLDKESMKFLGKEKKENGFSYLENIIIYYISLLFWSLQIITVNFFLISTFFILPQGITLNFLSQVMCSILSAIGMCVYSFISFNILLELVSFFLNIYSTLVILIYKKLDS